MQTEAEYLRWHSGYNFWRGQYTVRNQTYTMACMELRQLSAAFEHASAGQMDRSALALEWGAAIGKPEPPSPDQWKLTPELLDIVLSYREMAKTLERDFPFGVDTTRSPMSCIFSLLGNNGFPPEGRYMKFDGEEGGFHVTITDILDNPRMGIANRAFPHSVSVISQDDKQVLLSIDHSAEMSYILDQVRYFVETARRKEETDASTKAWFAAYDDWKRGKPVDDTPLPESPKIGLDLSLLRGSKLGLERSAEGTGYRVTKTGDVTRACGLWLYDYTKEHGCNAASALSALLGEEYAVNFYDYLSSIRPDKVLKHAKECIEKTDVIKISIS